MKPWIETYNKDLWCWITDCFNGLDGYGDCEKCLYKKACDEIWKVIKK